MSFRGALLKPSERTGRSKPAKKFGNQSRYEVLKDKIRTWWDDRLKIGEALREIQTSKLYKDEYATFEEFCEEEFDIKRAQAYRLIEASKTLESLSPMGDKIVSHALHSGEDISGKVSNERQSRALAAVPVEQRAEVLKEVAERGPVTAKAITATAKKIVAPAKEEKAVHFDKTGYAIPEAILPEWNRAAAFDSTLREISKIKSIIETATDDKDPIFVEVGNAAIAHLKNAYSDLTCVIPYAVCTSCQGRIPDKCTFCQGRGFISKFRYSLAPIETRRMREKKA